MDPNPILDIGCPAASEASKMLKRVARALGIEFLLEPLDCTPFFHGYGSNCSASKLVNGIWRLSVKALNSFEAKFPFYMVPGEGELLLGNEIHHKSIPHGSQNLMIIPPGVGRISNEELFLQTCHVPIKVSDENAVRTILSVAPAQLISFKAFFTSHRAFHTSSLI